MEQKCGDAGGEVGIAGLVAAGEATASEATRVRSLIARVENLCRN
jgi:hypothetical protein